MGDRSLSYGELNERAGRLAARLQALGVAREGIVAVCLERSFAQVEALLGIVKAGAAYLPLDPLWPVERMESLSLAASPQVVITTAALAPLFAEPALLGVLCVEEMDPLAWDASVPPPMCGAVASPSGGQLAYLSFTSGSTGTPKAVLVEEAGILRLFDPGNPYGFTAEDRVLQLAPASFDAATLEIWGALLHGGCLVLAPPGPPDLAELAELLQRERITKLWLTAGLFHAMVEAFAEALSVVPTVLAGGDALQPAAVRRLLSLMPAGHRLINGYGPTEATTFTTCHVLEGGAELDGRCSIPIGRPIAGTTVRVLDGGGQLCPIGIPGELHIGGIGLARGYLNQAELTAERFIADPYAAVAGERLYRSGDLVSWQEDGTLAFHGRLDHQVKWNGHRIEPGEIEAELQRHAWVEQALVMVRREEGKPPQLVAYWVAARGEEGECAPSVSDLRGFLAERLPEPMLPTAYVRLTSVPLTGNGKIDRRALPAPTFGCGGDGVNAPRTEAEETVHGLWSSVLGHREFGVEESFFHAGGHSLAAAQLAAAIAAEFARPMAVADLFRFPTVAAQAQALGQEQGPSQPRRALVALQPEGHRAPLFAVHGWGGTLGAFIGLARALRPDRPLFGLQACDLAPAAESGASVRAMAAGYAEEILRQWPEGPIHLIGFSAGGWYAHAVAEALLERGAVLGLFAILDTHPTTRIHRRLALYYYARLLVELRLRHPRRSLRTLRDGLRALLFLDLAEAEPFCKLLMATYRPGRLPLHADLFLPPHHTNRLARLWRFYATGGVTLHPIFEEHDDFRVPDRAEELARALDQALQRVEARG